MSKYWQPSAGKMKVLSFGLLIFSVLAVNAHAQTILGDASSFAVLGASTVTNTGTTVLINGSVGVSPGTSIVPGSAGFLFVGSSAGTSIVGGTAATAQTDALTAYHSMVGLSGTSLTGQNLGGLILGAGVYNFSSSAQLTGALTLNFAGASNETIVIDIGSTLTTASGSSVSIVGGNSTDSVYWVVGSSATLGTTTSFEGNIIALTSDTLNTGAIDGCGSVIALNGAVTLDANIIDTGCNSATTTTGLGSGTKLVSVPEGGSPLLYLCFSFLPIGTMLAFRFRRSI